MGTRKTRRESISLARGKRSTNREINLSSARRVKFPLPGAKRRGATR